MTTIKSIFGSAQTTTRNCASDIAISILANATGRPGGLDVASLRLTLHDLAKYDPTLASQVGEHISSTLTVTQRAEFESCTPVSLVAADGAPPRTSASALTLMKSVGKNHEPIGLSKGYSSKFTPSDPLLAKVTRQLGIESQIQMYNSLIRAGGGERQVGPFLVQGGTAQVREAVAHALERVLSTERGREMEQGAVSTRRLERIILTDGPNARRRLCPRRRLDQLSLLGPRQDDRWRSASATRGNDCSRAWARHFQDTR